MSTRNPFDPSDLSDDQTELDVQSFASDDDETGASTYDSYGFNAPQYGVPQDMAENLPSGTWQQEVYQDGLGTGAYGASTYGTYGCDASQYGAASATTHSHLQAASAVTVSPQVGTGRRRRIVMRVLFAFTVLLGALGFSWFDDVFQAGTERLVWTLGTCGAALIAAFACFTFAARRLRGEGSPGNRRKRQGPSLFAGPIGAVLALYAVSYGVPAIHDLVSGPQPKTVFSCMVDSTQTTKHLTRSGTTTVYKNHFTMTFEDGTSHMTTFETPYEHDIQPQGGLGEALYNACMFRDSEQTMILYYYPRTWILADVRLAD
ncbi:MAG: hypothetical protein KHZ32_00255 [Actinomyces sp.]|nr:hypothetical protein [Actinomyces sp.]